MDFFQHVVTVALLAVRAKTGVDRLGRARDRFVVDIDDPQAVALQAGNIAIVQVAHLGGLGTQRVRVRGNRVTARRFAKHQRAAATHRKQLVGAIAEHGGDRETALQLVVGAAQRLQVIEALVEVARHQQRHDFTIGFAVETIAFRFEQAAQRQAVFDDAVVHDRNPRRHVRMRVSRHRRTVGRPARVRNADVTIERRLFQYLGEVFEFALRAPALQARGPDHRDTG